MVENSTTSKVLADVLALASSLLALLNLPQLVICVAIRTGFTHRRNSDRAVTLLLVPMALLCGLFGW